MHLFQAVARKFRFRLEVKMKINVPLPKAPPALPRFVPGRCWPVWILRGTFRNFLIRQLGA